MADNKMNLRVAVGGQGHFGPNLYFLIVKATIEEYEEGLHYTAAERYVADNFAVDGPYWTVDHKDPAKLVLDVCKDWSKVPTIDCKKMLYKV